MTPDGTHGTVAGWDGRPVEAIRDHDDRVWLRDLDGAWFHAGAFGWRFVPDKPDVTP